MVDVYDFGICECKVVLHKEETRPKKKLVSSKKNSSVRFNVPWLPKVPTLERGSKKTSVATAAQEKDSNTPNTMVRKTPQQG